MKKMLVFAMAAMLFLPMAQLPNETKGWYYERKGQNEPPAACQKLDIGKYDAYYLGNVEQKEVYLTFDEGYENGYTAKILDVLLAKNVPAAFFVTKPYIRENPDLIERMVKEGHVVANHTVRHKSSPDLSDQELVDELAGCAEYYKEITGMDMPLFFRPPMGQYSERTLKLTQDEGYKTIFWSFAYEDWKVDKQPGAAVAHQKVVDGLHNGAILLLHAVSSSNAEAMENIIDSIRSKGYVFKSLHDLPEITGKAVEQ
jgi:peptidoglycan-N-acetylmuramic acid deacetylase